MTRWNHNVHYHRLVLAAVPANAQRALDIGCGEGLLTRQLRERVPHVVGIDPDEPSISLARRQDPGRRISYLPADFMSYPFEPASFDLVASVATLHHLDAAAALSRMRELLRPGGTLCVIGLARSELPRDLPFEAAAVVAHRFLVVRKGFWQHPSPVVWPPPHTYAGIHRIAAEVLPGVQYRRRVLWRYSLTWTRPR